METQALMDRLWGREDGGRLAVPSWRLAGACRGLDPTAFYPPEDSEALAARAKAVCAVCSVRQACAEFALETREKHGVWGGLTARERRRVLRQRRRSA